MTNRTLDHRARNWDRAPARAIRYWWPTRFADWLHAGLDSRKGTPDLLIPGPDGPRPAADALVPDRDTAASWGTPRTVFLSQLGRGKAERELVRYQAEVADVLVRLVETCARRAAAEQRLCIREKELDDLATAHRQQPVEPVSGEERTDPGVVQARRRREFAERHRRAAVEVERLRDEVAGYHAEIARLREPVRIRFAVAQTRAAMIDAYIRRRCAAYLTRLVRKHPDGPRIGALVRAGWTDQPRWTTREGSPDLGDTAHGDA